MIEEQKIEEKIKATKEVIDFLEQKIRDPAVYPIWKRKANMRVKELKIELNDLEAKLKKESIEV